MNGHGQRILCLRRFPRHPNLQIRKMDIHTPKDRFPNYAHKAIAYMLLLVDEWSLFMKISPGSILMPNSDDHAWL